MCGRSPSGDLLRISTPGRARTDTTALLGGSPLPLGYGGVEIVPQVAPFIQTFPGIGQRTLISDQIDISRANICEAAGPPEDVVEHGASDAAGERVLLTGVIAAEHQQAGQIDFSAVAEGRPRRRDRT